jgi:hypothetical protein
MDFALACCCAGERTAVGTAATLAEQRDKPVLDTVAGIRPSDSGEILVSNDYERRKKVSHGSRLELVRWDVLLERDDHNVDVGLQFDDVLNAEPHLFVLSVLPASSAAAWNARSAKVERILPGDLVEAVNGHRDARGMKVALTSGQRLQLSMLREGFV